MTGNQILKAWFKISEHMEEVGVGSALHYKENKRARVRMELDLMKYKYTDADVECLVMMLDDFITGAFADELTN